MCWHHISGRSSIDWCDKTYESHKAARLFNVVVDLNLFTEVSLYDSLQSAKTYMNLTAIRINVGPGTLHDGDKPSPRGIIATGNAAREGLSMEVLL